MKQVPDRKKLRREYLTKRGTAAADLALSSVLIVPLTLVFCLSVVLFCVFAFGSQQPQNPRLVASIAGLVMAGLSGAGIFLCYRSIREIKRTVTQLSYVPPVTPDTLPADEILVRGSEEPPVVQSEVLLRAAQPGQETAKEELLRVSQE